MDGAVIQAAEALTQLLTEQHGLACRLLQYAGDKENALLSGDLNSLRQTLETEEDAALAFQDVEKRRMEVTIRLISALGREDAESPSLRDIAGWMEPCNQADRLAEAGGLLAEVVSVLSEKNLALRDILAVKSDYAQFMLELFAGGNDGRGGYNDSGAWEAPVGDGPGVVEFFA